MTHRIWIGPHKVTFHADFEHAGIGIDMQWLRCTEGRFWSLRIWFLFWFLSINFNEATTP